MTARIPTADIAAALALADALISEGWTSREIAGLDPTLWDIAATIAKLTEHPSAGTRRATEVVMRERERHPDPFEGLPAAHGPRSVS